MTAMPAVPMLKLWEISDELDRITLDIFESGGEITEEIEAQLEAMEGAFAEKVERVALRIRELEATADAAKSEKDRLQAMEKANKGAASSLKSYLQAYLERQGRDRVETMKVRVRIQNSTPSIRWTRDLDELPEDYRRITIAPDIARVKEEAKDGAGLPDGFERVQGRHVRIY